jgi:hypothetical protein
MRDFHRYIAAFAVFFGLYMASLGLTIQVMDLTTLSRGAPATDETMQSIRVGQDGPPNFRVIRDGDYAAPPLPTNFDFTSALMTVMKSSRAALAAAPLAFVEFRTAEGRPVGQVATGGKSYRFDAATGAPIGQPMDVTLLPVSTPSLRNTIKSIHSMNVIGPPMAVLVIAGGLSLLAMIVTGTLIYLELVRSRRAMKRNGLFWKAGGWWRTLHRSVATVAAVFLVIVVLSGTYLSFNGLGINIDKALEGGRPGLTADVSTPLSDEDLPRMLSATLSAERSAYGDAPIKVVRLRHFAGMPQGIVIRGGEETRQSVFNLATGKETGLSGSGYPNTGMPLGWNVGQVVKRIHRGDIIGLTGRWMDLFAGLSLLYLTISGAVVYWDLWKKRKQRGQSGLFWSTRRPAGGANVRK